LLSAVLIETNFFNHKFTIYHVKAFEQIIQAKQQNAHEFCSEVIQKSATVKYKEYRDLYKEKGRLLSNQMMSFYVIKNNQLVYWSENSITFPLDSRIHAG
jgi:DNA-binding protein H-NS